jgi:hypothetical protein
MEQKILFQEHLNDAKLMLDDGQNVKNIEKKLLKKGIELQHLEEVMKEIKRLWHAKRTKTGAQMVIVGVILLGAGFFASILLHLNGSNSLDFPLYGLTAAGAIILSIGLVFIFN